jgi:uncharacterized protein (DUF433 family)
MVGIPMPVRDCRAGTSRVWRALPRAGRSPIHCDEAGSISRWCSVGVAWGMRSARITVEPDKMGGVPCIRGLRIPVATVVGMVAEGMTVDEILADYPDLEADDVRDALRSAAEAARERELPLQLGA